MGLVPINSEIHGHVPMSDLNLASLGLLICDTKVKDLVGLKKIVSLCLTFLGESYTHLS